MGIYISRMVAVQSPDVSLAAIRGTTPGVSLSNIIKNSSISRQHHPTANKPLTKGGITSVAHALLWLMAFIGATKVYVYFDYLDVCCQQYAGRLGRLIFPNGSATTPIGCQSKARIASIVSIPSGRQKQFPSSVTMDRQRPIRAFWFRTRRLF